MSGLITEKVTRRFDPKYPNDDLDYIFDWAPLTNKRGDGDWLESDETIVDTPLPLVTCDDLAISIHGISVIDSGKSVQFWVTGGLDLNDYLIECQITTNKSRTRTKVAILPVRFIF